MKKLLSYFVVCLSLMFSVVANAQVVPAISTLGVSGQPGDNVHIDVSLLSGSIALGGDFTIGFNSDKLKFLNITGKNDSYSPIFIDTDEDPFLTGDPFSLAYLDDPDSADGPIDNIFSIWFTIISPYPVNLPDYPKVDIGGYLWGGEFLTEQITLSPIWSIVTVDVRNDGTIAEPGALALVGLALLIMTGVGRRNRMNRG